MIDLLKAILDAITNIISFLGNAIAAVLDIIVAIPRYITYLFGVIALLPSWLVVFITLIVSVTCVYAIVKVVRG